MSEVVRREAELRVVQAFLESTPPGPMESEVVVAIDDLRAHPAASRSRGVAA